MTQVSNGTTANGSTRTPAAAAHSLEVRDRYPSVLSALVAEFEQSVPLVAIEQIAEAEAQRFNDATVRSFLEVLIRKAARRRLCALIEAATDPVLVASGQVEDP